MKSAFEAPAYKRDSGEPIRFSTTDEIRHHAANAKAGNIKAVFICIEILGNSFKKAFRENQYRHDMTPSRNGHSHHTPVDMGTW